MSSKIRYVSTANNNLIYQWLIASETSQNGACSHQVNIKKIICLHLFPYRNVNISVKSPILKVPIMISTAAES